MNQNLLTFKTFPDKETAEDFAQVLQQENIPYTIEEDALVFDISYAFNPLNKDYLVKIDSTDFTRATQAYDDYFKAQLDHVDPGYYLFSFTTDELKDIVAKPDEWGSFDYQLALKMLQQQGIYYTAEELQQQKQQRVRQLAQPEKESTPDILAYYLVSFFLPPVGLAIGYTWGYSKKTLPDGHRVYRYNRSVQQHGRTIFTITIILLCLVVLRVILRSPGLL